MCVYVSIISSSLKVDTCLLGRLCCIIKYEKVDWPKDELYMYFEWDNSQIELNSLYYASLNCPFGKCLHEDTNDLM